MLSDLIKNLQPGERIISLKRKTLGAERFLSVQQAGIITKVYKENQSEPVQIKRAKALAASLREISINIDPEELIAGNRTPDIRAGVVFPEAGIMWVENELDSLPLRKQDPFSVKAEDKAFFLEQIAPFWKGKTLEEDIRSSYGDEISAIEKVVKINQKDHAQGHICPDAGSWLRFGPKGLLQMVREKSEDKSGEKKTFYDSAAMVLEASAEFIRRYSVLASEMADSETDGVLRQNLAELAVICSNISERPPAGFREAVQSLWFLFVILQMESNASSFSPGRADQYLFPFYRQDLDDGKIDHQTALEIIDSLYIKFNQIVYMRNAHSARYFAGFPTGFNITLGGQRSDGSDATNELSFLFLKAQEHIRLPQPNITARLHKDSPQEFIDFCTRVIGLGTGMPQIVNDESIIPSLLNAGLSRNDAFDYALVGCVEISSQGNLLGWSDAAMFNMVKVLELTLNNGTCILTGNQTGLKSGSLLTFRDLSELESAFSKQIDHFILRMVKACEVVEKKHQEHLPTPFLSCIVNDCLEGGKDVTAGGAKYNFSGIQAIQVANIADCFAVLKKLIYDDRSVEPLEMLEALNTNFRDNEILRQKCINKVPKFGNDIEWVDALGAKWIEYFSKKLAQYKNLRGGEYHTGLYTVSAHIPMGENVGATPDGRNSGDSLADGGLSPMYGRDISGPTAVLNSVARIPSFSAPNGTLLNMKFLPALFENKNDTIKFSSFLSSFISLPVHHIQFNVVKAEDLIKAKADPGSYKGLTIRVAGYTAFFTELSSELQDEIIKRTTQNLND